MKVQLVISPPTEPVPDGWSRMNWFTVHPTPGGGMSDMGGPSRRMSKTQVSIRGLTAVAGARTLIAVPPRVKRRSRRIGATVPVVLSRISMAGSPPSKSRPFSVGWGAAAE